MLRVCRDIVSRDQRFSKANGSVVLATSNQLSFEDVQVVIRDVSAEGAHQSFDYFIATQIGRAILTKVGDKEGSFIEWVSEIDSSQQTPPAGVYYLNVDAVEERTRNVGFTLQMYHWYQGRVPNATGTRIAFRPGIDASTVLLTDTATGTTPGSLPGSSFLYLLSPVASLQIQTASGTILLPNTDYWVEQSRTETLVTTTGGSQIVWVPLQFVTISITDQTSYTLRPDLDYSFVDQNTIVLSSFTPVDSVLSVTGLVKLDPTVSGNLMDPENILNFTLAPGEELVTDEVYVTTGDDHIKITPNPDGSILLPFLLAPGGKLWYEARVSTPPVQVAGQKNALNRGMISGLDIAIGDNVSVGDQCAILVSPTQTETYHVYGATDSISFTLDVKANDPQTASRVAELIKDALLITRRNAMVNDGVNIMTMSRAQQSQARDSSGTAASFVSSLSISGTADWRVFRPLVTRLTSFQVSSILMTPSFPGQLSLAARFHALQVSGFLPDYR
jgi:hypothetical protein